MANRSDRTSVFPRRLKRMLSLMSHDIDSHEEGNQRRLFMDAHKSWNESIKKRMSNKDNVDTETSIENE